MAIKLVKFIGTPNAPTNPESSEMLEIGKFYEVVSEKKVDEQILYELDGYTTPFSALSFEDVPVYLATATEPPILGEDYICQRAYKGRFMLGFECVKTSTIWEIHQMAEKTYKVYTLNSCYIVTLM